MTRRMLAAACLSAALAAPAGCLRRPSSDLAAVIGQDPPTPAACERFLRGHPESPHARFVRMKLEALAWNSALAADTVAGYEAFLVGFPRSVHADQARRHARHLAFREVRPEDLEGPASQLLKADGDRPQPAVVEAVARMRERRFEDARRRNTAAAWREFCFLYPRARDPLALRARALWEQAAYREAQGLEAPEAFSGFLLRFPRGDLRSEAEKHLGLAAGPDPDLRSANASAPVRQLLAASPRLRRLGWISGLTQRIAAPGAAGPGAVEADRLLLLGLLAGRAEPDPSGPLPALRLPPQQSLDRTMAGLGEALRLERLLAEVDEELRRAGQARSAVLDRLDREGRLLQSEARANKAQTEPFDRFLQEVEKRKTVLAGREKKLAAEAAELRASLDVRLRHLEDVWFVAAWDPDYPADDQSDDSRNQGAARD